jgi:hypothetical protein
MWRAFNQRSEEASQLAAAILRAGQQGQHSVGLEKRAKDADLLCT